MTGQLLFGLPRFRAVHFFKRLFRTLNTETKVPAEEVGVCPNRDKTPIARF